MNVIDEYAEQGSPAATKLVTIALHALGSRALVWVGFLGAAGLWSMAMIDPSWIKLAVATGYCGSVLVPILMRDSKGG